MRYWLVLACPAAAPPAEIQLQNKQWLDSTKKQTSRRPQQKGQMVNKKGKLLNEHQLLWARSQQLKLLDQAFLLAQQDESDKVTISYSMATAGCRQQDRSRCNPTRLKPSHPPTWQLLPGHQHNTPLVPSLYDQVQHHSSPAAAQVNKVLCLLALA